ncbi:cell division protein FtsQ/DivIB [Desulfomonile tiedjei]|uniref:Cell division protein FtsQ n=1 Tax=Desulfomonile tiedjei (strain ATCC 49306 / DSM 6799 / DCB-1) TaxID=706587 RepID=I4CCP1_DESTA|nr:FtsQ-type POTRA domain-containing protein [Desulfomonile tiedjei]AFM27332.1 cell division septal protein [Desulfomonile tiedjei DSM 6799]
MSEMRRPLIIENRLPKPGQDDPSAKKNRNRKLLKYALFTFLGIDALLAAVLIYILFLHVPYFNLKQVDVTGNRKLSRAEVVEASELEGNINLLTVDLSAIAARLKRHPWIRSASVYRRFPGQLIIEIEERTPRAILVAGNLYYVDEQAEPFTRHLPGDPLGLPLFTGVRPEDLKTKGAEIQEMIRIGLLLLDSVERSGAELDPNGISEIRIDPDEGLTLQTGSGKTIVLGKNDFEGKLQKFGRLKRFLTQKGEWNNARIINLDFEDRALVRWDKAHLQG